METQEKEDLQALYRPDGRQIWVRRTDVLAELRSGQASLSPRDFEATSQQLISVLSGAPAAITRAVDEIRTKMRVPPGTFAAVAALVGEVEESFRQWNLSIASRYPEEDFVKSLAVHLEMHGALPEDQERWQPNVDALKETWTPEERAAAFNDAADENDKALAAGHPVWQERPGTQRQYQELSQRLREAAKEQPQ